MEDFRVKKVHIHELVETRKKIGDSRLEAFSLLITTIIFFNTLVFYQIIQSIS